ncbi:mannose-1-phosphate guanyltransferase alpha-A isoform X2 [Melanaphis sacchari]|uniref:Mannose-1-phosphate guanyltransferase alpha-A n=1 Tax=Melanaphis sacchari TaxID=742174 RepID=A0A2H8TVZ0_9HEMI|nr:mannose-1-phosphate guanyltransferase alpha-A isoform X2 [Melanaphis sacchari]
MLKAVILIGGPSKGTRFRPLSLDVPKPLFPVAGLPVVQHHIDACYRLGQKRSQIPEDDSNSNVGKYCVAEVLLLGYYGDDELSDFLLTATQSYPSLRIRYLREPDALGTAGGLYHFRDTILAPLDNSGSEQVQAFFVMNGDVCADFPLDEMLNMHFNNNSHQSQHQQKQPVLITVMATETTRQQSVHYGCMVVDKETNIIQHYVEKPSTFVSNTVNCGVYLCSPRLFDTIADIHLEMLNSNGNGNQQHTTSNNKNNNNQQQQQKPTEERVAAAMVMWMEQDVLRRLAGESGSSCSSISSGGDGSGRTKKDAIRGGVVLAATTRNWWSQLKTAGAAIYANRHYLALRQQRQRLLQRESVIDLPLPSPVKCRLATADPKGGYSTIGNVYVHPSAQVHPTALLGPNVSVGEGACIDQGVRIKESIVLQDAVIGQHSLVMHSIIGRRAKVGAWCRVEGSAACSDPNPNVAYAKMTPQLPLFNALDGRLNPSITILGCGVNVESEVVLLNSIVLPYKTLTRSYKNEIIL